MTRHFLLGLATLGVFAFTPAESKAEALLLTSVPLSADTLAVGSMYFDSEQTFQEVIKLSVQHDNEGIARLIQSGQISHLTREENDIVVLKSGSTPESLSQFRFLRGPTTFWTLAKNVTNFAKPMPTPLAAPTTESTPLPAESPMLSSKLHHRQNENKPSFEDDKGKRTWHQVDGKRKRYPVKKRHAADGYAPAANPRFSPIPAAPVPAFSPRPTPSPLIISEGTNLYNSDLTQPFKDDRKP